LRRGQKGQALAELLIVLPLFASLIMAAAFWADLMLAKLALTRLTRDYAVLLAREGEPAKSPQQQLNQLRLLAEKSSHLDSRKLSLELSALPPTLVQDAGAGTEDALALPGIGGLLQSMLLGQRLVLRYEIQYRGLLGRALPHGLVLRETVAFKSDPWNNPADRLLHYLPL
jgi:hypothetical protein